MAQKRYEVIWLVKYSNVARDVARMKSYIKKRHDIKICLQNCSCDHIEQAKDQVNLLRKAMKMQKL